MIAGTSNDVALTVSIHAPVKGATGWWVQFRTV